MRNFTAKMLLKNLISKLPNKLKNLKIKGLASNSNEVKKGYIFFALKGKKVNGEKYINSAISRGAILIICSKKYKYTGINSKVLFFRTNKVDKHLHQITSKYYNKKPKTIIAVTGTNGKTSVADFFFQILNLNKIPVASIGTLGIKYKNKKISTSLTTPDIISLHRNLELLKKKGIDKVILEASSHGLHQGRLKNLNFKAGIFTNFTQDHLDYHKNMKNYLSSKLLLFKKFLSNNSYIISDKNIKEFKILQNISKEKNIDILDINKYYLKFKNNIPDYLKNTFQIKNLLMAILAARLCKVKDFQINKVIIKMSKVEGRLDFVRKFPNNIKVYIDYAHTPDALNEALNSLRTKQHSSISLVFGCGGERDQKKRPIMAKIANKFCNKIYVTDDNPRNENPDKIRNEIVKNLSNCQYRNIANRSNAIKTAILNAEPDEIVLVAGKGHENFQDYGKKRLKISDKEIINKIKFINRKMKNQSNYFFNSKILNKILRDKRFYKVSGLALDSRDVKKDNLFLTIKGKKFDGNTFINKARKNGASYIVSSKTYKKKSNKIIKVKNTLNFLNYFAKLKRENTKAKIIAITGSAGKTSLKNMLFELLSVYQKSYVSPRSFNNHLGVPVSLSNLNYNHRFGVFEVGMNKPGEIKKLTKMIKPDLAVITNVAEAHIENFRNLKGIAEAKCEIMDNVKKNGIIILNRDDKFFNHMNKKAKLKNLRTITFGKSKKSNIQLVFERKFKNYKKIIVKIFDEKTEIILNNLNNYNVLSSLAVLRGLSLNLKKIYPAFKDFQPSEGRGKIHKVKRYKKIFNLIDESYNANPLSMKNAIRNFADIKKEKSKKYLILGDMLELGEKSDFYHKQLSGLINNSDIDKVFIKGEKSLLTYKNLKNKKCGNILQCDQDVDLILKDLILDNDYLMVKGSNATGLNNVTKAIIKGN